MERIKLVTDSSCDLPSDIISKYNINLISLNVSFGQESFIDRLEIDNNTFYERMGNEKELPKTSCPSPDRFVESYEGEEENILVIPCCLKYRDGYLFLTSFLMDNKDSRAVKFRLDKIYSFRQVRMQDEEEKSCVKKYLDDMTSFAEIEEYKTR